LGIVRYEHHVRVEHRDESVEVTVPGGSEERFDHLLLGAQVGVGNIRYAVHLSTSAARELTRRGRRAIASSGHRCPARLGITADPR
jgi:hypothetical protein